MDNKEYRQDILYQSLKLLFASFIFMLLFYNALISSTNYYLSSLNISDIDDASATYKIVQNFSDWFNTGLSNYGLTIVSNIEESQISFKPYSFYFEGRLIFHIKAFSSNRGVLLFEEETYTTEWKKEENIKQSVLDLSERVYRRLNGEKIDIYKEKRDETVSNIVIEDKQIFHRTQIITLVDLSYFYPAGGVLDFLEYKMIWLHPGGGDFGIGVGTTLAEVFFNMPGYTNMAGTLLPLEIYFPVSIDLQGVNDWYIVAKWSWYKPVDYSDKATNTNINFFVQNPITSLDLSCRYFFLPFMSASLGITYFYDKGTFSFYLGASIFLGFYNKQ